MAAAAEELSILVCIPSGGLKAGLEGLPTADDGALVTKYDARVLMNHHFNDDEAVWENVYEADRKDLPDPAKQAREDCRHARAAREGLPHWGALLKDGGRGRDVTFANASVAHIIGGAIKSPMLGELFELAPTSPGGTARKDAERELSLWYKTPDIDFFQASTVKEEPTEFPFIADDAPEADLVAAVTAHNAQFTLERFEHHKRAVQLKVNAGAKDAWGQDMTWEKMGHSVVAALAMRGVALDKAAARDGVAVSDANVRIDVVGFDVPDAEATAYYYESATMTGDHNHLKADRDRFKAALEHALAPHTRLTFF